MVSLGISSSDVGVAVAVFLFYIGTSVVGLAVGMYHGEITNRGEAIQFVNPVKTLNSYNRWFVESWYQRSESARLCNESGGEDYCLAKRNSWFGMFFSFAAILVLYLMMYGIIKIPFGGLEGGIGNVLLPAFIALVFFALAGGFDAPYSIIANEISFLSPPIHTSVMNATATSITSTTTVVASG